MTQIHQLGFKWGEMSSEKPLVNNSATRRHCKVMDKYWRWEDHLMTVMDLILDTCECFNTTLQRRLGRRLTKILMVQPLITGLVFRYLCHKQEIVLSVGGNESDATAGNVRVYQYHAAVSAWLQLGQDIKGEARGDRFGFSVSLSSDGNVVAAAGAQGDGGNNTDSGYVRVYQYNITTATWMQLGNDLYGEAAGDEFGYSVSLSGDGRYLAAGAPWNNGSGYASGHDRVFQYSSATSAWLQIGQELLGEADLDGSGWSVSMARDHNVVAIGAFGNDELGSDAGHVRVYQLN